MSDIREEEKLTQAVFEINSKFLGLILGTLFGLLIFIITNWLIIKGGYYNDKGRYIVGPHLELLSQFFLGYKVSFFGSIVGFLYGFALGTIAGSLIGWIYNKIVRIRKLTH